jgi:outer membrane protein TolC
MRKHFLSSLLILSLVLPACSLAPVYQRPQTAIPGEWSSVPNAGLRSQQEALPYWKALGNEELNHLVDLALAQNLDLEAALHRIEEARAQAKIAGAPLYPSVSVSGGATRTYKEPQNASAAQGVGNISYEVDLWGKNRNQAAAANYRADASQYDREALRLVVTSDVTTFYAQILAFNERMGVAENNLRNAE